MTQVTVDWCPFASSLRALFSGAHVVLSCLCRHVLMLMDSDCNQMNVAHICCGVSILVLTAVTWRSITSRLSTSIVRRDTSLDLDAQLCVYR